MLLNIKRIGICGSEIHSYHGCHPATFYPVVQGHEYSAVVVATGGRLRSARRVTLSPHVRNLRVEVQALSAGDNICEELRVQAFSGKMELRKIFLWLMMTGLRCCLKVCHLIMGL